MQLKIIKIMVLVADLNAAGDDNGLIVPYVGADKKQCSFFVNGALTLG